MVQFGTDLMNVYQELQKKDIQQPSRSSATDATARSTQVRKNDTEPVKLSDGAQKILDQVKERFKNMDVFVADFSSDEEADKIMSRGTREFSALFSPDELEKMAADEEYAKKQMENIGNAVETCKDIHKEYGVDAALEKPGASTVVTRVGVKVDAEGKISIYADIQEMTEKQKERIAAQREKKAAQKKEDIEKAEAKKAEAKKSEEAAEYAHFSKGEKTKTASLQADTLEEMLEKLKNFDWSSVKEDWPQKDAKFDLRA